MAANLQTVWVATRAAVRGVLDETSLADVVSGKLSPHLRRLVNSPQAWEPR